MWFQSVVNQAYDSTSTARTCYCVERCAAFFDTITTNRTFGRRENTIAS